MLTSQDLREIYYDRPDNQGYKEPIQIPTPAEVAAGQAALTTSERAVLKHIASALCAATEWPLTYSLSLLRGCRVKRIVQELEQRQWSVEVVYDQRDGDYLSIKG